MSAANLPSSRLVSLDALRGFDMLWIVGADAFAAAFRQFEPGPVQAFLVRQFDHPAWAGFTFYDLIFPLFLFMMGTAIPFSLDKIIQNGGRADAVKRILRRSLLLYVLGVIYYGGLSSGWDEVRWVGVLQRLAICYLAASLLYLFVRPRGQVIACAALLLGYWALLTFVPVPDIAPGDYSRGQNLANWIDANYLPGKVWYGDYDPEGLLGTLPAVASCLFGVFAGRWLRQAPPQYTPANRSLVLALGGVALIAIGGLWAFQFPIVKRIWTSSYALVAGGGSAILLGLFYYLIDVRGWKKWAQPFVWIGTNALTIYLLSRFIDFGDLSARLIGGPLSGGLNAILPGLGALAECLLGIALCVAICRFLYRHKVFIRL
ncbi:DUF5009 domain-containing protein [Pelagicoccus enzymogenes]|uniref:acyltransferase family protein n=1 Tax=Pelagicoccus enzymogenes TaxID=2773457 RepID=UPI00280E69DA|nr:DUF5009 domain-containing protein [Pelagicoccus enzymogenes]MDQ8199757.1 DUF5009 domain-containing protein [Pelagicoccus enzymogenes]